MSAGYARGVVLRALFAAVLAVAQPSPIAITGDAPASSFTKGAAAYFRYANQHGGVHGAAIAYRLVEPDSLEPSFARLGPELQLGDAAVRISPSAVLAGAVLARYVVKMRPVGRVAVLSADEEFLDAFRRGLGSRPFVATTVRAELRGSAVVVVEPGTLAAGLPEGAVTVTAFKDAHDLRWVGDPGLAPFRAALTDARAVEGAAAAFALVDALRRAGPSPTRSAVIAAARRLNEANNPFVIPGIVVKPPIRQVAIERRVGGRWSVFTGPLGQ